eukprot:m51a1_g7708 hypothetical protein (1404) ;mRNA; r:99228-103836
MDPGDLSEPAGLAWSRLELTRWSQDGERLLLEFCPAPAASTVSPAPPAPPVGSPRFSAPPPCTPGATLSPDRTTLFLSWPGARSPAASVTLAFEAVSAEAAWVAAPASPPAAAPAAVVRVLLVKAAPGLLWRSPSSHEEPAAASFSAGDVESCLVGSAHGAVQHALALWSQCAPEEVPALAAAHTACAGCPLGPDDARRLAALPAVACLRLSKRRRATGDLKAALALRCSAVRDARKHGLEWPSLLHVLLKRAALYLEIGYLEAAKADATEALELDWQCARAHLRLAQAQLALGKRDLAAAALSDGLAAVPNAPELLAFQDRLELPCTPLPQEDNSSAASASSSASLASASNDGVQQQQQQLEASVSVSASAPLMASASAAVLAQLRQQDLKVVVLGSEHSGKTSLVACLLGERVRREYRPTKSSRSRACTLALPGEPTPVRLRVVEVAGSERFERTARSHLRDADAAVLVVDASSEQRVAEGLESAWLWRAAVESTCGGSGAVPFVVAANKCDAGAQPDGAKAIEGFCAEGSSGWFATSCKRGGPGVLKAFRTVVAEALKRRRKTLSLGCGCSGGAGGVGSGSSSAASFGNLTSICCLMIGSSGEKPQPPASVGGVSIVDLATGEELPCGEIVFGARPSSSDVVMLHRGERKSAHVREFSLGEDYVSVSVDRESGSRLLLEARGRHLVLSCRQRNRVLELIRSEVRPPRTKYPPRESQMTPKQHWQALSMLLLQRYAAGGRHPSHAVVRALRAANPDESAPGCAPSASPWRLRVLSLRAAQGVYPQDLVALCSSLCVYPYLTVLDLRRTALEDATCAEILRALSESATSVALLDLRDNRLGDACAACVTSFLAVPTNVTGLLLGGNRLSCDGFVAVAKAALASPRLTRLDVGGFAMNGSAAASCVCDLVRRNTTLVDLNCSAAAEPAPTYQAESLISALMSNATLTSLDLSGHGLSSEQEANVRALLARNRRHVPPSLACSRPGAVGARDVPPLAPWTAMTAEAKCAVDSMRAGRDVSFAATLFGSEPPACSPGESPAACKGVACDVTVSASTGVTIRCQKSKGALWHSSGARQPSRTFVFQPGMFVVGHFAGDPPLLGFFRSLSSVGEGDPRLFLSPAPAATETALSTLTRLCGNVLQRREDPETGEPYYRIDQPGTSSHRNNASRAIAAPPHEPLATELFALSGVSPECSMQELSAEELWRLSDVLLARHVRPEHPLYWQARRERGLPAIELRARRAWRVRNDTLSAWFEQRRLWTARERSVDEATMRTAFAGFAGGRGAVREAARRGLVRAKSAPGVSTTEWLEDAAWASNGYKPLEISAGPVEVLLLKTVHGRVSPGAELAEGCDSASVGGGETMLRDETMVCPWFVVEVEAEISPREEGVTPAVAAVAHFPYFFSHQ